MHYIVVCIIGIVIGSFLNVCICRIPQGKSIAYPGSHCTYCQHPLSPLDLIPIVSYLMLGGKCRYCQRRFSIQYPIVEGFNGLVYVAIYHYFGWSIGTIAYFVLASILLTISVIDYYTMRIPNILIIWGLVTGIVYRISLSIHYKQLWMVAEGIIGVFVGAGIIGAIMIFSLIVFKKEGMGMGDLKLLAMIGLFIGSPYVLYTIFIAVVFGGFFGMFVLLTNEVEIFPFGPFISLGAVIALLWGDTLWNLYLTYIL